MNIKEIRVQQLIKTITKKDMLFHGNYTLDPYQNCDFGCIYCDSSLDDTVFVKINALEILKKELQTITPGRIIIGSVHDPYQQVEQRFHITHNIISFLTQSDFSVHILTKSPTILNDLSLLNSIKNPLVTITIIGLEDRFCKTFEPNVSSPLKRLEVVRKLNEHNIKAGIAIIPTFPGFSNNQIENLIIKAKEYNASYVLFKSLFLQGDQKESFLFHIKEAYPKLYQQYLKWFQHSQSPPKVEIQKTYNMIKKFCRKLNIPNRI